MDWDVRRFSELDSTNTWLLDRAREGAPEGLVAVADHQTAGRGRLGRTWVAPPGSSLLMSVLLRPAPLPLDRLHLLTVAVALSAADACWDVAGVDPDLKWPNDLLVGGRKLAGILAERDGDAVVVGMGMNVQWPEEPPAEIAGLATTLVREGRRAVVVDDLLDHLLDHLARRYPELDVVEEYRRRCATIGAEVRVELAGGTIEGTAVRVDDDGALVVRTPEGVEHRVTAGDVVHLFPGSAR